MKSHQVLEQIVFLTYVDLLNKRKQASSTPNVFTREINSLHDNTTINDLGPEFRKDIKETVELLVRYLYKTGFVITPRI